jgi:hypothetical protein
MRILLLFISCLAITCCKRTEDIPEGILKQNQMMPVMLDIYLAESQLTELRLDRDTTASIFDTYEGVIFERHNVDHEQYKKSLTYYYDHTKQLEIIYEAMLDTLTIRDAKLKAKQAKADSSKLEKQPIKK